MKLISFTYLRNSFFTISIFSFLLLFSSCASKMSFCTSSVVPAASGLIKIKNDKNKNYSIQIKLLHLAQPDRLQPPKKTYVVWMTTDLDITKNIGQINTSTSLFSKKLKASFKTVSSFNPKRIFITAEDDANLQFPGSQVVLSTGN